jgi:tetratricopeptide (TPR) repeat protein
MPHGIARVLALALAGLLAQPVATLADSSTAAREAVALQEKAMARYKKKDFPGTIKLLEQVLSLTPNNHELLRQIGTCHVHLEQIDQGYDFYKQYTQRCPKCMYAPKVREMIRQYEASQDLPPSQPSEESLRPAPASEPARAAPAPRTPRAELLAKRLLANARTIRAKNHAGAVDSCLDVLRLMPSEHPLHAEARALYTELTGQPPPALSASGAPPASQESPAMLAKRRYEEAYVVKGTNPELARRKLEEVLRLVSEHDIYHAKARRLLEQLSLEPGR